MSPTSTERQGPEPLRRLLAWAEDEESVRAIVLTGSRAASPSGVDALSDHDIVLFLTDGSDLARRDGWLERFGSLLVMLRERSEHLGQSVPTRLVQYREGARIDVTLSSVDVLARTAGDEELPPWLNDGYEVLLDKDGLAARLGTPSGTAYIPERPDASRYRELVEEFWWETLYVAKFLARDELLPARYSFDCVIRFRCLVRMLEWYVQVDRGWAQPVGLNGRGLPALLPAEERRALEATFAGADPAASWEALFETTALFRRAARRVAANLGFAYPSPLDRAVERLLRQVRATGKMVEDGPPPGP